jgi:ferrochelatase
MTSDAVLLTTLGGPRAPDEIRPFVEAVTRGKPVPKERLDEVVRHYEAVGGASPIHAITDRQAVALRAALHTHGTAIPVHVGMRIGPPSIADALARMAGDGVRRCVAVILAAFRSDVGLGRYREAVAEAATALGERAPAVEYVDPWFDHPLFIDAVEERIQEALASLPEERRAKAAWLFTAHSIPVVSGGADTYQSDFRCAVDLVCDRLGRRERTLAYQSRSGSPREPWLGPDVKEALKGLAAGGTKDVLIVPIGFVADHVEVLYDLDLEARQLAEGLGVRMTRVPTPGDHPAFIAMLADLVRRRLGA